MIATWRSALIRTFSRRHRGAEELLRHERGDCETAQSDEDATYWNEPAVGQEHEDGRDREERLQPSRRRDRGEHETEQAVQGQDGHEHPGHGEGRLPSVRPRDFTSTRP